MPHLNLPPEQQQKLQTLVANLRAQDNVITLLAEFAVAGYNAAGARPLQRPVHVTPDGRVELEYAGPQLVDETGENVPGSHRLDGGEESDDTRPPEIFGPRTAGPHKNVYDYVTWDRPAWVKCRDCGAEWREGAPEAFPETCEELEEHDAEI